MKNLFKTYLSVKMKIFSNREFITTFFIVYVQSFAELIYTYFTKKMATTGDCIGLARIDPVDHPVDLFRIWRDETKKFQTGLIDVCCLATVSSPYV